MSTIKTKKAPVKKASAPVDKVDKEVKKCEEAKCVSKKPANKKATTSIKTKASAPCDKAACDTQARDINEVDAILCGALVAEKTQADMYERALVHLKSFINEVYKAVDANLHETLANTRGDKQNASQANSDVKSLMTKLDSMSIEIKAIQDSINTLGELITELPEILNEKDFYP